VPIGVVGFVRVPPGVPVNNYACHTSDIHARRAHYAYCKHSDDRYDDRYDWLIKTLCARNITLGYASLASNGHEGE